MAKLSKIVKIKYEFDTVSLSEVLGFTISVMFLITGAVLIIVPAIGGWLKGNSTYGISLLVVAAIVFIWSLREGAWRKGRAAEYKHIVENGTKVIGEIKNLSVIKLGDQFTYDIEYGPIDNTQITHVVTPMVISSKMGITEKDLPLKVVVYVLEGKAVVYAIIDPPVKRMARFKAKKNLLTYWPIPFLLIILIICANLSANALENVSAIVGFSGLVIVGLYCYIMQFHIK